MKGSVLHQLGFAHFEYRDSTELWGANQRYSKSTLSWLG